uniref:anthranilate synthase n=2 Tax=Buchnera aphidicola TaxID=9 RepID=R9QEX3_BUCMP|nr:TrpG [Buchnera aphidicola str. USDA (Myzus persicae)]
MANILLLDNIDSFTYNLVEPLRNQDNKVLIYRNRAKIEIILKTLQTLKNPILMLSPEPGLPQHAGCMLNLIKTVTGSIPIGICLGR